MRSTHTLALLDLPKAMYEFIRDKMKAAGYEHAFLEDGSIDMHGIGLSVDEDSAFLQSISNPPVAFSENGALFWYGDPAERRDFTGDLYAAQDDYRRAVDEALVVRHLGVASGDARSDLKRVLDWDVAAALDPAVSSDAQALIDRGRSQLDSATEITGASRYAEPRASAEAEQEAYARGLRKAAQIADAKARRVNSAWIAQDIAYDIRALIPEN